MIRKYSATIAHFSISKPRSITHHCTLDGIKRRANGEFRADAADARIMIFDADGCAVASRRVRDRNWIDAEGSV